MTQNLISTVTAVFSGYQGLALTLGILILILVFYKLATIGLKRYISRKAFRQENVENFLFMWRYIWLGFAFLFTIISLSGSIAALGISAAFLGMILGWSLQAPVTGIAAWLMIIVKRPFKLGDRIIVNGIIGDVTDITLTHIILNQVGGTVAGEEKSGRVVMIPNATLFQQIIHNYTSKSKYILDEVVVSITYESSYQEAEKILLNSAKKITKDIIEKTGQEPFVRLEIAENGIRTRLRYQTLATNRQMVSTKIIKNIIDEFNQNKKVEFAYPHTEIVYQPKKNI